jgi:Leucine-rich repeat (LRR) protein
MELGSLYFSFIIIIYHQIKQIERMEEINMSELAKKRIEENLQTKNPYLDLGNWRLDGTEPELRLLAECKHLETLILSYEWIEYDETEREWIERKSQNQGHKNILKSIPSHLPQNLQKLIIAGLEDNPFEREHQIHDISSLQDLKQLKHLDLSLNAIHDISFLQNLKQLQYLDLNANYIQDISFLQNLKRLQYLNLSSNEIHDISSLQNLKQLQYLSIESNKIQDISFLQGLRQLQYLNLRRNQIQDISFLQELRQLQYLDLSSNEIKDISFLQELPQLQSLDLSSNEIKDISFLQELPQLQSLDLSSNEIKDISFLKNLTQLEQLNLDRNPMSYIPIWLIKGILQKKSFTKFANLKQTSFASQICNLLSSGQDESITLARQLAQEQGWKQEDIEDYVYFFRGK